MMDGRMTIRTRVASTSYAMARPIPILLHAPIIPSVAKHGEDRHHHGRRAGHHPRRLGDALPHGVLRRQPTLDTFTDPARTNTW